jgi:hypothetical protein
VNVSTKFDALTFWNPVAARVEWVMTPLGMLRRATWTGKQHNSRKQYEVRTKSDAAFRKPCIEH